MKRLATVVAAAMVAAGLMVLGHPAPAAATAGSVVLPRGDAPAAIDITKFSVDNAERTSRFRCRSAISRERAAGSSSTTGRAVEPDTAGRSLLIIVSSVGGHARTKFLTCDTEVCLPDKCLGLVRTGMRRTTASASLHRRAATREVAVIRFRSARAGSSSAA